MPFTWPTIAIDVQKACEVCHQCQKRKRVTVYDRVPVNPIPRDEAPSIAVVVYVKDILIRFFVFLVAKCPLQV